MSIMDNYGLIKIISTGMKKVFHTILGYLTLIVNTAIVWLPVCILGLIPERRGQRAIDWITRLWCRMFLKASGVSYEFHGLENIHQNEAYVIMSNHRSHMDGPVLVSGFPSGFSIIAKKELAVIPFWGWALYLAGNVALVRHDAEQSRRKMSEAAAKLKTGRRIMIFPEGTRSGSDDFLPFKKGGAVAAIEAQVPILPVGISGTRSILPKGKLCPEPGHAVVRICKPIPTAGLSYDDRNEVLALVEKAIRGAYIPGPAKKENS
jgi:1-acyl-sn-glycerol-3-phosphate acyltransferase